MKTNVREPGFWQMTRGFVQKQHDERLSGRKDVSGRNGFSLLEVVIVLFILGLIAAMVVPAMGVLDDLQRERMTRERMDLIRRAILGPDDRFDENGRRVVGGYVGDMRAWPGLWEARAEIKPNFGGNWEDPSALPSGLGQGPDYTVDPDRVFFRPFGRFEKGAWKWYRPYRRLYDDTSDSDHIGGLETENEGQPRGLWTRFPEDLPFDLPGHPAPGLDLGENWNGPYITPPADKMPKDSGHLAENNDEYEQLLPAPRAIWDSDTGTWLPTWEDGDYSPSGGLGEYFDEKEDFRLMQTDGRLEDGWGRAFRFFITEDPSFPGETVFWIVSEGPDGQGTYPSKGTCSGNSWTVDPQDTMGLAYDETDSKNLDNIVMKLYSRDWQAVFDANDQERIEQTGRIMDRLRASLAGQGPLEYNTGFSGDMCRWPRLFRWEDNGTPDDPDDDYWDDRDGSDDPYTKGQPRGLWTSSPNDNDAGDDLPQSSWGIGWRHAYAAAPHGAGEQEVLRDAWGREILFFHDAANDSMLLLSRGPDGRFDFGTVNADGTEPLDFTEALDISGYDPSAPDNLDNIHRVLKAEDRLPGYFRIDRLVVLNATPGTTKCRFFRDDSAPVDGVDILTADVLTDEDGDLNDDDWAAGEAAPGTPAFNYDDTTVQKAAAGARYLVCWNDSNLNNDIDSNEEYQVLIFNVTPVPGSSQYDEVVADADDFRVMP